QGSLTHQFPHVANRHNDLVTTLGKLAALQARPDDALLLLEEAKTHALAAVDIGDKNPTSRRLLSYTDVSLGGAFLAQKKLSEADDTYRKAIPLQRELADEFVLLASSHNDLVNTLWKLALLQSRPQEAVKLLDEAKTHVVAALKISNRNPVSRRFY